MVHTGEILLKEGDRQKFRGTFQGQDNSHCRNGARTQIRVIHNFNLNLLEAQLLNSEQYLPEQSLSGKITPRSWMEPAYVKGWLPKESKNRVEGNL